MSTADSYWIRQVALVSFPYSIEVWETTDVTQLEMVRAVEAFNARKYLDVACFQDKPKSVSDRSQ